MAVFFAGAAVAALATSTSQGYNYTGDTVEGFVKVANSELNTGEYGNHHEQRIKFTVPMLQTVFKENGKFIADCGRYEFVYGVSFSRLNNINCFHIAFVPDRKFTRPIYRHTQKLVRFTGNKNIQRWNYTFDGDDYNVCMTWASGPIRSSENMDPNFDSSAFTPQAILPYDGQKDMFENIRNSPVGEPFYPSIFGRYYDPATMFSYLNGKNLNNMAKDKIIAVNDLPMIQIAMFRCEYDNNKIQSTTNGNFPTNQANTFPSLNSTDDHKNTFLDTIPSELGFEYVATTESKTVEEMMSAVPKDAPYSSPSTIEIVSISIGSVALAIGLSLVLPKISCKPKERYFI